MGNALAAFLDHLKCETAGSDEQFVIMGTSYGAKVAQYALSLMETEDWMEHPDFQSCQPELMHKTRLFISQEGPHIGDNIPLSLQHYAWSIPENFPNLFFADEMERTFIRKVLNSRGVRENLLYHVSTANNGNHGPAPEWTVLHDSLRALRPDNMGFPVFCKKVAVINGMLTGEAQYSPRDGVQFMADG
jgi:hypothetical protein